MLVSVFDTRVSDNNLGNAIIMESVDLYLRALFPRAFFIRLPCLDPLGADSLGYLAGSEHIVFGGTNALSSDMRAYRQWALEDATLDRVRGVVLMGVGWWQYQDDPTPYTAGVLRQVLHPERLHAVRDSYAKAKLHAVGIDNVLMTGCPTMWGLTPERLAAIPRDKAENVLVTFTNYNQHESDRDLLRFLQGRYAKVFCWVQGPEDWQYALSLGGGVEIIDPSLEALDRLLCSPLSLDYVGTRLHAGIRALQFGRRAVIIGVDNRALEKGRDFGLPVVPRGDEEALRRMVEQREPLGITLPWENIGRFLGQFDGAQRVDPALLPPNSSAVIRPEGGGQPRTWPVSRLFGFDRGTPVDRRYIRRFMAENAAHIRGRVLEVGDSGYTRAFGQAGAQCTVLGAVAGPGVDLVGDFATGEGVPRGAFDCVIATQTFNVIFEVQAALEVAYAALAPGGALLFTVPGISQVSRYDMDRWGDYWRFTDASVRQLLGRIAPGAEILVRTFGNVFAAKAFLDGLAEEELPPEALDEHDVDYQVIVAALVRKPL